jgi:hypothetical protein
MSEYFPCNIGVRQGENLSPFLFSIYLNDLQQFLEERNVCGLDCISEITLYILPLISFPSNLCQRPFLQTVSKAFAKSINAQYNFFF